MSTLSRPPRSFDQPAADGHPRSPGMLWRAQVRDLGFSAFLGRVGPQGVLPDQVEQASEGFWSGYCRGLND